MKVTNPHSVSTLRMRVIALMCVAALVPVQAFAANGGLNAFEIARFAPGSNVFGTTVAIDGDTAIVGNGQSALVLVRDGSGSWHEQDWLVPVGETDDLPFVAQVDVSGNTALVGNYVFERDDNGEWRQVVRLPYPEENRDQEPSVAIEGDTIAVASLGYGWLVSIYQRDLNGEWINTDGVTGGGSDHDDGLYIVLAGDDLAVSNDYLEKHNCGGDYEVGSETTTFRRQGDGQWQLQEDSLPDELQNPRFWSLDGDTAVVSGEVCESTSPCRCECGDACISATFALRRDPDGVWVIATDIDGEARGAAVKDDNIVLADESEPLIRVLVRETIESWSVGVEFSPSLVVPSTSGYWTALDGNMVLVGAPTLNGGLGAAYLFLLHPYAAIVDVSNSQNAGGSAAGILLWDEELQRNVARVYDTNSGALISETTIGTSRHSMKSFISTSDMSGDSVPELSATGVHSTSKVEVFLRDSITGAPISDTPYPKRNFPRGSVFATGFTQNEGLGHGGQGLGVLGVDNDNRTSVVFKDALSGELIEDIRFGHNIDAIAVESLSDVTGNGVDEVAVLGNTLSGRVQVSIRDSMTKEVVSNLWFGRNFTALDFGVVPDLNNNEAEEIAVLGVSERGYVNVTIKDSVTGELLGRYPFASLYVPIALVIVADSVPLVGVLGRREIASPWDDSTRVTLKGAATGDVEGIVYFADIYVPPVFAPVYVHHDIAVLNDANGNFASELAVLGFDATGQAHLQIKDSQTGEVLIVRQVP